MSLTCFFFLWKKSQKISKTEIEEESVIRVTLEASVNNYLELLLEHRIFYIFSFKNTSVYHLTTKLCFQIFLKDFSL